MQVLFVSKYPPIEGFVSSYAYWLARGLGERGHQVFVATNAQEVDTKYREDVSLEDPSLIPKGVTLRLTCEDKTLGCIPYFNPFTEKLASLALDCIDEHGISLIDSWYLMPYGIAGLMVSLLSGLPLVGRVAGTDGERMCRSPQFNRLALSFFEHCSQIVGNFKAIPSITPEIQKKMIPHGIVLHPSFIEERSPLDLSGYPQYVEGIPVITFIGKATSFKGFFPLVDALSQIPDPFLFLVVSNGPESFQFTEHVRNRNLEERTLFLPFQPPWKMPAVYRSSTVVACLEHGNLIQRAPIVPREAASCGRCTVISPEIHSKGHYRLLENGVHTVIADPDDPEGLRSAVHDLISHPEKADVIGQGGHDFFSRLDNPRNHSTYIDGILDMYRRICE
ncbi:MAG: glycosyltransferase family 4 protein [Theionarchaea archaeon]|nr:glycosyltransferase family 4 protein [Theionarchaea archaeon]MBU7037897.1 glycosyltransferase family 4 protein [Theionarchaea archaeon]